MKEEKRGVSTYNFEWVFAYIMLFISLITLIISISYYRKDSGELTERNCEKYFLIGSISHEKIKKDEYKVRIHYTPFHGYVIKDANIIIIVKNGNGDTCDFWY